ncbi:CAMK family protein kinase [Trichomonas vaginalis G3]|uniref:non-specific serine/threonine protein kinase n=1 Tax=Trichomonas vaginalis (strain ATCC PRA-98 / G3) TaxID=412133 RepID=A2D9X6_TRIV3|nr:clathrin-coated pit assembly [Trichomonas vaginalis G3]EAY22624.1 CAMK family protein kinase [Trichomonas vaginalis G3]KAI5525438.1 clathrin-coated pit assembly [Trichomonas vaginalis G3]|eukprot:XP_001583610.1 CAMK family protein kinase [Trichomonas vaginalis G3]
MFQYVNYSLEQIMQPTIGVPQQVTIGGMTVTIKKKFAEGGFAQLYSCRDAANVKYAIKYVCSSTYDAFNAVIQEFNYQKALSKNPNIVKVYGMLANQRELKSLILMEFCDKTLVDLLNKNFKKSLTNQTILGIFIPICEAMKWMHCQPKPLIHRDIKVENVLQKDGQWKLCDFGSTTDTPLLGSEINDSTKSIIEKYTTPNYRAPEAIDLFRHQDINTKYDIWSLGCLLFKLCTYKDAFNASESLGILNARVNYPNDPIVDIAMKTLIKYILNPDPVSRPTIDDVLAKSYDLFPNLVSPKYKSKAVKQPSFDPFAQMNQSEKKPEIKISRSSSEHNIDDLDFDDDEDDKPQQANNTKKSSKEKKHHHHHHSKKSEKHSGSLSDGLSSGSSNDPFAAANSSDPFNPNQSDPFAQNSNDPFAQSSNDPFAPKQNDPFAPQQQDPFAIPQQDPFAAASSSDPFAVPQGTKFDPFAAQPNPFAPRNDPFATSPGQFGVPSSQSDPFANSSLSDELIPHIDAHLLETDQKELERQLLMQDDFEIASSVTSLYNQAPNATILFLFTILPRTGSKARAIFSGVNPALVDEQLGEIITMLKSLYDEIPGLKGDFSMETKDTKWAQPLLTLVDVVCQLVNQRFIEELAYIIVGAYNGVLMIHKNTYNINIKLRLKMSADNVTAALEKLGSNLTIEYP